MSIENSPSHALGSNGALEHAMERARASVSVVRPPPPPVRPREAQDSRQVQRRWKQHSLSTALCTPAADSQLEARALPEYKSTIGIAGEASTAAIPDSDLQFQEPSLTNLGNLVSQLDAMIDSRMKQINDGLALTHSRLAKLESHVLSARGGTCFNTACAKMPVDDHKRIGPGPMQPSASNRPADTKETKQQFRSSKPPMPLHTGGVLELKMSPPSITARSSGITDSPFLQFGNESPDTGSAKSAIKKDQTIDEQKPKKQLQIVGLARSISKKHRSVKNLSLPLTPALPAEESGTEFSTHNDPILKDLAIDFSEVDRIIDNGIILGQGAFGTVYKGELQNTAVAVKVMNPPAGSGAWMSHQRSCAMEDFKREVSIMSKLRHQNVVLLMRVAVRWPTMAIMTEYLSRPLHVPGTTQTIKCHSVLEYIQIMGAATDFGEVARIMEETACGMQWLHHNCVVHGDLTASNLLLANDGTVKIVDFGLSKFREAFSRNEWAKKDIEQEDHNNLRHGEEHMEQRDVYNFGVILWQLITGEIVPKCPRESVLLLEETPELPQFAPKWARILLAKCWNPLREKRPPFQDIVRFLRTSPTGRSRKSEASVPVAALEHLALSTSTTKRTQLRRRRRQAATGQPDSFKLTSKQGTAATDSSKSSEGEDGASTKPANSAMKRSQSMDWLYRVWDSYANAAHPEVSDGINHFDSELGLPMNDGNGNSAFIDNAGLQRFPHSQAATSANADNSSWRVNKRNAGLRRSKSAASLVFDHSEAYLGPPKSLASQQQGQITSNQHRESSSGSRQRQDDFDTERLVTLPKASTSRLYLQATGLLISGWKERTVGISMRMLGIREENHKDQASKQRHGGIDLPIGSVHPH